MASPRLNSARLSRYLCSSVLVLLGIACGGTTDSPQQSSGGSSAGGASGGALHGAGSSSGGAAAGGAVGDAAGVSNGGSNSAGAGGRKSTGGSLGQGGAIIVVGGSGVGGTTVNEDCPDRLPTGTACTADDAGITCQYDIGSGCLCYMSPSGTFQPCQKVDPACPIGGAAGQSAGGAGGVSAKIALPPRQVCSCSASSWTCTYGI